MSEEENKAQQQEQPQEEQKKEQLQNSTCEACKCTGWKVGFWLCFVCCIIVFIVMLILFIKKRKFQEKVIPIVKEKIHNIVEKTKNKLDKVEQKSDKYFNNKMELNKQYKEVKDNFNNDSDTLSLTKEYDDKINELNNEKQATVNAIAVSDILDNNDPLKQELNNVVVNNQSEQKINGGNYDKLTSISPLGF